MSLKCSVCGVDCTGCELLNKSCKGCSEENGKIFWTVHFGGVCPIYDCAVNNKHFASCSDCPDLPCELYFATKDPSMSDEEHLNGIKVRVENLKKNINQ